MVLLEDLGKKASEAATRANLVGEKICKLFGEAYVLGDHICHVTPSIGSSLLPYGQPGINKLLKRTDLVMSQAMEAGGNTVRFFDPQMQAAVVARAHLGNDLREALAQRDFLTSQGCHTYKGYLFSRPVAVGEFEALVLESATPQAPLTV